MKIIKNLIQMGVVRDGSGTHETITFQDFMTVSRGIAPRPTSMLRSRCAFGFAAHSSARDSGGVRGFPAQHAQGALRRVLRTCKPSGRWRLEKSVAPLLGKKSENVMVS